MYRIHQIKLGIEEDLENIPLEIKKVLNNKDLEILEWKIVKESIDARKKNQIKKVFSVDFSCKGSVKCDEIKEEKYFFKKPQKTLEKRPIVIGFGPCGIFASLILAEAGLNPIVFERGKKVEERAKDVKTYWEKGLLNEESNIQFGEGGAGTFSDGKLTTGTKNIRIRKILEELSSAGGGDEILYKAKAHIGTDKLRKVVTNIREKIIGLGGEIEFNKKVVDLIIEDISKKPREVKERKIIGVKLNTGEVIYSDHIVLAIGHSARDTFQVLKDREVLMEQKPFSMGVRVEHLQKDIDKVQYGDEKIGGILGPADYKLSHRCKNGRGVYTFCMCPGGKIIMATSEKDTIVTNGMSYNARNSGYANSGLLVDIRIEDFESKDVLAGVEFQRKYEKLAFKNGNGKAPETNYKNFSGSQVANSLPDFVVDSIKEAMPYLGRKLRGFDGPKVRMVGVETRSSSPVRILRNENLMTNIDGLYPGGEGAGYAGGIMSAAVDGVRIAEKIIDSLSD